MVDGVGVGGSTREICCRNPVAAGTVLVAMATKGKLHNLSLRENTFLSPQFSMLSVFRTHCYVLGTTWNLLNGSLLTFVVHLAYIPRMFLNFSASIIGYLTL
uniref:Uncharacterized protein n=1 Tax=Sphaerodactylus townsendi TaxID=933632 RepID=A0ACB8F7Y2_9SAUR